MWYLSLTKEPIDRHVLKPVYLFLKIKPYLAFRDYFRKAVCNIFLSYKGTVSHMSLGTAKMVCKSMIKNALTVKAGPEFH